MVAILPIAADAPMECPTKDLVALIAISFAPSPNSVLIARVSTTSPKGWKWHGH